MPHLHPPNPPSRDTGAERTVWEVLRDQLPDDAVLFAGVGLQDDEVEREIDLLVAWPGVGLAAIEVKGGHVTRDHDGWWQSGRDGRHLIDPVHQAQQSRHVLTRLLRRHGLDAAHARIVHMLALPHSTVDRAWVSAEIDRAMVLDRSDLADLSSAAGAVKRAIDQHGVGRRPLEPADVGPLVDFLTGAFGSRVEMLAFAAQHEDRVEQLTRDQARILDVLRQHDRLRVVGGAGSGKTYLALEQARRRAKAGERVALLCYSRGLGRYLERVTATWPPNQRPAFVGLFHDLPLTWGAQPGEFDDSDYWERRLPTQLGELAATRPAADLFDTIVVDEAQDFGDLWWPSLMRCLRSPETGGLFVFMDKAQHVFARDGAVPIDTPPITLDENLRSTKQIAQLFGAFGDDVLKPRNGAGVPVRLVDVQYDQAVDAADDVVDALLAEGWEPGQVALVATGRRHPAQAHMVELAGHAAYWDDLFAETDVFYGHVLGFKGLERTAVVLAVNGFRDMERARTMLYTGLSRARVLLVVVGPRAEMERLGGEGVRRRFAAAEAWQVPSATFLTDDS